MADRIAGCADGDALLREANIVLLARARLHKRASIGRNVRLLARTRLQEELLLLSVFLLVHPNADLLGRLERL